MWGAAGFGAATFISGLVYDHTAGGYRNVAIVFVVVSVLALVAAFGVRVGTNDEPPDGQEAEESRYALA